MGLELEEESMKQKSLKPNVCGDKVLPQRKQKSGFSAHHLEFSTC